MSFKDIFFGFVNNVAIETWMRNAIFDKIYKCRIVFYIYIYIYNVQDLYSDRMI